MKAVLTRVSEASVTVDGEVVGSISCPDTGGLLALVGVGREDSDQAWETMVRKIAELRILDGERSVEDAERNPCRTRTLRSDDERIQCQRRALYCPRRG